MASNLQILETVWDSVSPRWKELVPELSQENMANINVIINSDHFDAFRNEIYDALVNLIAVQKVWTNSITNRFSAFKTGTLTNGDTIQEISNDVIQAYRFQIAEEDQFEKFAHITKASYHKPQREEYFPVTIEETHINRAFRSDNGLQMLLNNVYNQMYNSNDLVEMQWFKRTIRDFYNNSEVPLQPTQIVEVPPIKHNILDRYNTAALAAIIKGYANEMTYPKTQYNPFAFTLETKPEDMVLLIDSALTVAPEIVNLTGHWNSKGFDVPFKMIEFDTLVTEENDGMDDIYAILMHKEALRCYDILRKTTQSYNARNLYHDYYYHVHQLFLFSAHKPSIFFKAGQALEKVPLDVRTV